jgi:hypothetical protein
VSERNGGCNSEWKGKREREKGNVVHNGEWEEGKGQ